MTVTPNSSKILGLWRRSPRSSDNTPTLAKTPPGHGGDLDIPAAGDVEFQSVNADAKLGAFEISIAVFREAASLASSIPYLGAVAGIFVQIIRIKGVRGFPSLLFPPQECFFVEFVVCRKSICIARCGKRSCTTLSRSSILLGTSARRAGAMDCATKRRFRRILSGS